MSGIVRGMVTGDQDEPELTIADEVDAGTADGAPGFIEVEPVWCICEWATADTGTAFYSRIVKPHPDCQVHRR